MAGRHHERRGLLGVAYRRLTRPVTVALLALALLAGLGVATLLRIPGLPPPVMMRPTPAPSTAGPLPAVSPTGVVLDVSASSPPTAAADLTGGPGRESGRTRKHSRPEPLSPSRPETATALNVRYTPGSSWETGFIGGAAVTNTGGRPQYWQVQLRYPGAARVRVTTAWNVDLTRADDRSLFRGGPLAPGATATFGFEATKSAGGAVSPIACTIEAWIPE